MLLPLLYPSQRYPLFYLCTFYCCLCLCLLSFVFSFVLARCPYGRVFLLIIPFWILVVFFLFSGYGEILRTSALNSHHHFLSTTSHLRESFNLGKIHFTSLISFRGWFTGVTHIYLSLLIRGISSHGMVGNCWVSFPSVHISHSVGNLEIETGRRPIYLLFLLCLFSSLRNGMESLSLTRGLSFSPFFFSLSFSLWVLDLDLAPFFW
jgi:energy-coupling factor transporter transmembrane protein EcfT